MRIEGGGKQIKKIIFGDREDGMVWGEPRASRRAAATSVTAMMGWTPATGVEAGDAPSRSFPLLPTLSLSFPLHPTPFPSVPPPCSPLAPTTSSRPALLRIASF